VDRNDPYLILLRRELTRAQARLRRAERERDRALAMVERLRKTRREPMRKSKARKSRR